MNLTRIKVGDVVRVDDGMPYYALVEGVARGEREPVMVQPLTGPRGLRRVGARKIIAHWRRTGTTRKDDDGAV